MTHQIYVSRRSIQLLRIMVSAIFLVAGANHLLNTLGPLFKNIAILGGLLFFVINDPRTN